MPFSQIPTAVTILNSGLIGYCGVSLTNYSTSALSAIASGSAIEIAGAFFKADADITINATSWTAITTATTAYVTLTPSGTAGSQILTAEYSATAPTWSTSKQGWYASAASSVRYVAQVYKVSSTQQSYKANLLSYSEYISQYGVGVGDYIIPGYGQVSASNGNYGIISLVASTTYATISSIISPISGIIRVKFSLRSLNSGQTCNGRIYKNGVAFGTEQSATSVSVIKSEDLSFSNGDIITLMGKSASDYVCISGFGLCRDGVAGFHYV